MRFPERFEHGKYDLCTDLYEIRSSEPTNPSKSQGQEQGALPVPASGPKMVTWKIHVYGSTPGRTQTQGTWKLVLRVFRDEYICFLRFSTRLYSNPKKTNFFGPDQKLIGHNGENGWFRTDIQKTLDMNRFLYPHSTCRCCKAYLLCSKRSENIINRKIGNFYIEDIPKTFSQLRKNIIFFEVKKIWKIVFGFFEFFNTNFGSQTDWSSL